MSLKYLISKVNPSDYKKLANFRIIYGATDTKFGKCFLALNNDSVCYASFLDGSHPGLDDLKKAFPKAELKEDNELISKKVQQLLDDNPNDEIKILLKGTDFETKVWEELVNVKKGSTCTYEYMAKAIGNPKAVRAVARAIARNNISYLVPCHRVIGKNGSLSGYRWGPQRKLQMLRHEKAM